MNVSKNILSKLLKVKIMKLSTEKIKYEIVHQILFCELCFLPELICKQFLMFPKQTKPVIIKAGFKLKK